MQVRSGRPSTLYSSGSSSFAVIGRARISAISESAAPICAPRTRTRPIFRPIYGIYSKAIWSARRCCLKCAASRPDEPICTSASAARPSSSSSRSMTESCRARPPSAIGRRRLADQAEARNQQMLKERSPELARALRGDARGVRVVASPARRIAAKAAPWSGPSQEPRQARRSAGAPP